jgi:hypothetical protein
VIVTGGPPGAIAYTPEAIPVAVRVVEALPADAVAEIVSAPATVGV